MVENKDIKILIVCSGNAGYVSPFVLEQVNSLIRKGIIVNIFQIKGRGVFGYLSNYFKFIKTIKIFNPHIIHAHYGLSGMLAILQNKVPVITTFHGSDINASKINFSISQIVNRFSIHSIFVGSKLVDKLLPKKDFTVLSCGINIDSFYKMDQIEAKDKLGFNINKKYVLFSSSFSNKVKNAPLAFLAIKLLQNVELIEMDGYTRDETNLLMNSCDALLVTSFNESGPLVVKEAMACGCPIISTDVGDVIEVIGETEGCYIARYDAQDIADKLNLIFNKNERIEGRDRIIQLGYTVENTNYQIIKLYRKILEPIIT